MQVIRSTMADMIRESGLSVRAVSRRSNIPEATIRNILHGRVIDPRLSTVDSICRACGTTIERLFSSLDANRDVSELPPPLPETELPPVEALPEDEISLRAAEEEADAELRAAEEHLRRALDAWERLRGMRE